MPTEHPNPPPSGDARNWPTAPRYGQAPQRGGRHERHSAPGFATLQRPAPESAKSFPLAWALSLFFGLWGADRFYLGRWKTGLLKFFTAGGLFVWWAVDIALLTMRQPTDARGRPLRQFETIKWPSRIISGVVVAGFFAMFVLGSSIDSPTPPPAEIEAAGAVEDDVRSPEEEPTEAEDAATADPVASASPTSEPTAAATSTPAPMPEPEVVEAAPGTALAMLAELEEKGRAPKTGYDRDSFGWREDLDRNGCDTRNDILRRDLDQITLKGGTGGCVVLLGTLDSPYSGDSVDFDRTDSTIDIDHVVALSDAWQTGAGTWDEDTRREFANDPLNLLAVEASLNRQKGAGDAATWLPPKKDYRCEYVARQIAVKAKYDLWVKPAEADAMERVLEDCEGFAAFEDDDDWPATGEGDVVATHSEPTPEPEPEPEPAPEPDPAPAPKPAPQEDNGSAGGSVHFKNCDAARAAGAAPVRVGDPGYARHLDRDGDGVGCE
ncbi:GmrSD restriction endonuclease domain-containing protein [Brachybacterium sp.]|uniref:GmrSD restriction endonuclease domain-containing protein n=1 Tax=Brachybacterium sp. TaxID=1891286 RepID=UPI002ED4D1DE